MLFNWINLNLLAYNFNALIISLISFVSVVVVVFFIFFIFFIIKNKNTSDKTKDFINKLKNEEKNVHLNPDNDLENQVIEIEYLKDFNIDNLIVKNHSIEKDRITHGLIKFEKIIDTSKTSDQIIVNKGQLFLKQDELYFQLDSQKHIQYKAIFALNLIYNVKTATALFNISLINEDDDQTFMFSIPSFQKILLLDQFICQKKQT